MRRIIVILTLGLFIYLLRRLRLKDGGRAARRPGDSAAKKGEELVRDRVCNTFIPARSAIAVRQGDSVHFFCSPRCRDHFLEKHPG